MVFTASQLQEKCREQHQDLYVVFVDLTKAFDTVNQDGLWSLDHIGKTWVPAKVCQCSKKRKRQAHCMGSLALFSRGHKGISADHE